MGFLLLMISNMIKLIILSLAVAAVVAPQLDFRTPMDYEEGHRDGKFPTVDVLSVEARDEDCCPEDKKFRQARSLHLKEGEMPVVQEALEFLAKYEKALAAPIVPA